jgi:hypothetical protein
MCPLCGARKPIRGKRHCASCLARARNNNEQYRYREEVPVAPSHMELKLKRAYDPPSKDDGCRILVDRLWPRGFARGAGRLRRSSDLALAE